ncbi:hypothetical protein PPL_10698 [Heterostelium album PN500]|uniref:Cathepsin propeptide inhibitor domain-containing protein n=1 Tax=Heterostelium pallidum (strain ATCC 26659 / Pp 5 / PN500) TaxID=670386 RepID=D3BRT7_HETP5|nr:hypothetical protein PPL_10698 [Heterostelium album PN500]EFA76119.1 hypothetical protein PPL_10698 [Heterostelium album PN500]|eukprot:XP_020428253.1 hypothetical protein PPL_10698 [Heterostelium album PN500]
MRIHIILFIVISINIFSLGSSFVPNENDLWNSFVNWQDAYGIAYSDEEIQSKFANYKETLFGLAQILVTNDQVDILLEYPNITESRIESSNLGIDSVLEVEPIVSYPNSDSVQYSMNEFSDMSNAEYQQFYNGGADPSLAVENALAVGGGLTAGVIAAISAAGVVIVGGAIAGTVVAYKKFRHEEEEEAPVEVEMSKPKDKRKSFIDIFNLKANRHKSITARAAPIPLDN